MPTEASSEAEGAAEAPEAVVADVAAGAEKSLNEAIARAEATISEAVKAIENVVREGLEKLKSQTGAYTENPSQHLDEAQRYLSERVKERPLTATFAGLGVGLLLGLLISNRSR